MTRYALVAGFLVVVGLLATILFFLVGLQHEGITIHVSGQVDLANSDTGSLGKVNLVMDKPVNLIATGPNSAAIPANFSVATCPKCGGSMIPIRWNPITGEIIWQCLNCGYTTKDVTAPDSDGE